MKITAIYDNGGKTLDRFTVITDQPEYDSHNTPNLFMALGLSMDGDGFSQFCTAVPGRHLGRRVQFETLSANTQAHIVRRIFE